MKYTLSLIFTFIALISYSQKSTDVLMTVGNKKVTVGEFKYIYEKNNKDNANYDKKTIDEYLDLYKKFKLKVANAEKNNLDSDESISQEINNYKNQLSSSYYKDNILFDQMAKEVFERKQYDIRVSHILVGRDREKANKVIDELRKGAKFENLVKKYSTDEYSIDNGGDLGYLTSMLQPGFYDLENAIYSIPVGKTSDIIQSPLGLHIIKVTDKRKSKGKVQVAQIGINKQKNPTPNQPTAKQLIEQAYKELKTQNGNNWNSLVKEYSSDRSLVLKNGLLPYFGQGEYEEKFENEAFGLKKINDFSKPFETSVGYHILKKIGIKDYKSLDNFLAEESNSLKNSKRYSFLKSNFKQQILKEGNYKLNDNVLNDFKSKIGKKFNDKNWEAPRLKKQTLFTFDNKTYTNQDFLDFIVNNPNLRVNRRSPVDKMIDIILKRFQDNITRDYIHNKLSKSNTEYSNLYREYEEGILLFESTKRNVWDKASNDLDGLKKYYESNKDNYKYNDRAEVVTYTVKKDFKGNRKKFFKAAKKHKSDPKKVIKKFDSNADYISFEKTTLDVDQISKNNKVTSKGEELTVILKKLPARHKNLDECKGFVIADYQNEIEKQWIKELEKEFPVVINQNIYKALIKK